MVSQVVKCIFIKRANTSKIKYHLTSKSFCVLSKANNEVNQNVPSIVNPLWYYPLEVSIVYIQLQTYYMLKLLAPARHLNPCMFEYDLKRMQCILCGDYHTTQEAFEEVTHLCSVQNLSKGR